MKSAALEFGEHKITVNALVPGLIDTPLTRHRQRYEQAVDDLQSKQPTAVLEEELQEADRQNAARRSLDRAGSDRASGGVPCLRRSLHGRSGATYDVTGGDSASYTA